jgi:hypothetical protein
MPTLLGRRREREALEDLLEDVRSGSGWALVVRGEAGVGKTAGETDAARYNVTLTTGARRGHIPARCRLAGGPRR